MKKPIFVSLVVIGLLVGTQQLVSEKVESDKHVANTSEADVVSGDVEGKRLLVAGNVPCNPAKQVCED